MRCRVGCADTAVIVLALLRLLAKTSRFPLRLTQFNSADRADSETCTLLAAFANTEFYGDGMRIAPEADFTDGKLDICRISPLSL